MNRARPIPTVDTAVESVLESADSRPELADSTTDSPVGMSSSPLSNPTGIARWESADTLL